MSTMPSLLSISWKVRRSRVRPSVLLPGWRASLIVPSRRRVTRLSASGISSLVSQKSTECLAT